MPTKLNFSKSNVNRASALVESNVTFFTISPNPTSGQFTLTNLKYTEDSDYDMEILNISGQSVLQMSLSSQQETINLVAPSGDYFVNLNTSAGVAVRKITKL